MPFSFSHRMSAFAAGDDADAPDAALDELDARGGVDGGVGAGVVLGVVWGVVIGVCDGPSIPTIVASSYTAVTAASNAAPIAADGSPEVPAQSASWCESVAVRAPEAEATVVMASANRAERQAFGRATLSSVTDAIVTSNTLYCSCFGSCRVVNADLEDSQT